MRLVPNLAQEFEELCVQYAALDQQGKDIVALVKMFGDEYDELNPEPGPHFSIAWSNFLEEHRHQMTVSPMVGLVLYVLITYWHMGQVLFTSLPTLEKMLVRDTVAEISEEIKRRSAENGNAVIPA